MSYKVSFYTVIDTRTNKIVYENRDAYYLAEKLGVSYQLLIIYAKNEKLIHNRFMVFKEEADDVSFPAVFRHWFINEWKKMQEMFHVKHA